MMRERPAAIPPTAVFIEEWNEWGDGPRDDEGRYTGLWKSWRQDGSFAEEAHFLKGVLHGEKRRFYEDGQVAMVEISREGIPLSRTLYRPGSPTVEPHDFQDSAPEVVALTYSFTDDGWFQSQKLLSADGRELADDGTPAPPRPAGLPVLTSLLQRPLEDPRQPGGLYWQMSEWAAGTGEHLRRSLRQEFALDGQRIGIEYAGHWIDAERLSAGPLIDAWGQGDARAVEAAWLAGLQHVPGAALQAAIKGLTTLAARIVQAPEGQAPFEQGAPARWPDEVPLDAVWVGGDQTFIHGQVRNDGIPVGTVSVWDYQESLDAPPDRSWLAYFDEGPQAGRVRLCRWRCSDYWRIDEIEYPQAGEEVTLRVFDAAGSLLDERIENDGVLVRGQCWAGGRRIAEVLPAPGGRERYLGLDGDEVVLELTTEAGQDGGPVGDGLLMRQGEPVGVVPFSRLQDGFFPFLKHELAPFVPKLMAWVALPTPEELRDIVNLDWSALPGAYEQGIREMPFLLTGLTSVDDEVFDRVFLNLDLEVEYDGELSPVAAPVMVALLRLLPSLAPARQGRVLERVHGCWRLGGEAFGEVMVCEDHTVAQAYRDARSVFEALADRHEQAVELLAWADAR
jgi:hypothetical protein